VQYEDTYEAVCFSRNRLFRADQFLKDFELENGKRVVKFRYSSDIREKDKVSRKLLQIHYAIASILYACGGVERDLEIEDDKDGQPISSTAPAAPAEQQRWSQYLSHRLERVALLV